MTQSAARGPNPRRIAIVGGGASGILLASELARAGADAEVALIDPSPGRGIAYRNPEPHYLLNTRVGNMSLDPHAPEGFLKWLNANARRDAAWTAEDFAPRARFGDYLEERLATLVAGDFGGGPTRLIRHQARAAEFSRGEWSVRLDSGESHAAQVVVLATGWARPRPLLFRGREAIEALVQDDPWNLAAVDGVPDDGDVLLIGTGLTALDVAMTVWRRCPKARITAVSRHGMLPRFHGSPAPSAPVLSPPYPTTARGLYTKLRTLAEAAEADGAGRHGMFLGLRDVAAQIWAGLGLDERRMFLRHLRRYWDVERHRVPPSQAAAIRQAMAEGRFQIVRGRLTQAEQVSQGSVRVSVAGGHGIETHTVHRVINCTGPDQDPFRSRNPLIRDLLAQGKAAADPLGLGLQVDEAGAVLDSGGAPTRGLYALGPPTQGRFFEITAVPEIRAHAECLAARLKSDLSARSLGRVA